MNGLSSLDEIYMEYSLAPTDNLITFWWSEFKGQGCLDGRGIHVDTGALKSVF